MSFRPFTSALVCAAALAACGDLKTATPSDDAGASSPSSGSPSGASASGGSSGSTGSTGGLPNQKAKKEPPPGYGPGPHGALPSGYCCNDDSECRSRHCEDLGGGKMCLDTCFSDPFCTRPPDFAWTCKKTGSPADEGLCKPSGAFTCIPADQFELGTRATGECCTDTHDGWAGLECMGARCNATGDNPFVCSQVCVLPKDCPSGFACEQFTDTRKECVPANRPYTCK